MDIWMLAVARYKRLEDKLNNFQVDGHDLELGRKTWTNLWDGHPVSQLLLAIWIC